jgi:hypothetical protein
MRDIPWPSPLPAQTLEAALLVIDVTRKLTCSGSSGDTVGSPGREDWIGAAERALGEVNCAATSPKHLVGKQIHSEPCSVR